MSQEISNPKIRDFKDLVAWQKAHRLAVNVYKATEHFPKDEHFGLTNQVRRASVSVASNIAEGFGRRTKADRIHFYDMARASLHEVQAQMLIAKDISYLSEDEYANINAKAIECHKILTGLINKTNE
jgi:four helix bundle protein